MKLLSVAVPCYNSASYMSNCIESLLVDLKKIEIIIVNDGSTKDNTAEIADMYASKYPETIKVIHKENGGHGSAVNTGIKNATGKYFKVVDSDDKLDPICLKRMLEFLETHDIDMVISNFIYDKVGANKKRVMNYRGTLPVNQEFTWQEVEKFNIDQYFMMHSLIYKTEVLHECGLELPEKTFYVDNIYVYYPLPFVKSMYYLDLNLYYYFIGRADQSVNENVMISRIDQQIRVNKMLFDKYDLSKFDNKNIKSYMYHHLTIITIVSSVLLIKDGKKESLELKKELWRYFKKQNRPMFRKIRHFTVLGRSIHIPGKQGRLVVVKVYKMMQKRMGFN